MLQNAVGEPLGRDTTLTLTGAPVAASVGFASGRVTVPRDAPVLLRIRHVNTDTVSIVIARVPERTRSRALSGTAQSYSAVPWAEIVGDSVAIRVATPAPQDSEAVFTVPITWIPVAWRDDPLVLVRAMPAERIAPPARDVM